MGDISKNFSRSEFACKCGCGFATVDVELIEVLERIRQEFKKPITINSGCRCEAHNKSIGGADGSKHKLGIAADIVISGYSPFAIYQTLNKIYSDKYGIGKYKTFTHIDVRPNKSRWG